MAHGDYARLVALAQADTDAEHRQLAMSQISIISPYVGFHGKSPADAMAAPVIDRLYPQAKPSQHGDGGMAAAIAQIEAEARAQIEQIIAEHQQKPAGECATVNSESDQQTPITASSESGD
jgi:hypothetical protein